MATKEQRCDYCGATMGFFEHSARLDGPLSCGSRDCDHDARDDDRARYEEARVSAEEDGYERYGGPGRW